MDPINYSPTTKSNYPEHQAIRTQIDSDGDWEQFSYEYYTLFSEVTHNFDVEWDGPSNQYVNMDHILEYYQAVGVNQLPPSIMGQLDLPQFGSDMFFPTHIDPSLTPPWTDPSTSNSSPSATSSRMSISTSSTSTPNSTPSSTSEGSFSCRFCAQTFAKKCLMNRHINTHTKPRKCPFPNCTVSRAENRDLKRHIRAAHDRTSASAYLCTEKGCKFAVKGFNRQDNLKRHMENIHPRLVA